MKLGSNWFLTGLKCSMCVSGCFQFVASAKFGSRSGVSALC
ncbi:hypothetical protein AAHH87_00045 [Candidatus Hodgkinia cicadicola]